eukprot:8730836-Lingulodinium_polyedra.AAC.1
MRPPLAAPRARKPGRGARRNAANTPARPNGIRNAQRHSDIPMAGPQRGRPSRADTRAGAL